MQNVKRTHTHTHTHIFGGAQTFRICLRAQTRKTAKNISQLFFLFFYVLDLNEKKREAVSKKPIDPISRQTGKKTMIKQLSRATF